MPVWHASVAPTQGHLVLKETLAQRARTALDGVGDRAHEWHEWTGYASHLRRRLTPAEQAQVGEVRDIRGTPEATARYQRIAARLPQMARRLAQEEIRVCPA